jgi:hypothetical protein
MDPVLLAQLRRQWPLVGAVLVFVIFVLVHFIVFQPSLSHYRASLRKAGDMGLSLEPAQAPRMMPARVFALLSDNALPTETAEAQGNSGELTASLIAEVSRLAGKHGMEVAATEPGATTQQPRSVQVRAHVRVNGSYGEFVGFLDDLSRSGRLISVDKFSLTATEPGRHLLDLWVTRYVLKQSRDRH